MNDFGPFTKMFDGALRVTRYELKPLKFCQSGNSNVTRYEQPHEPQPETKLLRRKYPLVFGRHILKYLLMAVKLMVAGET